ncbi:alpha/beta hydrolase fold protein [Pseudomonas fluorescens]|uniref:Alpha/beta hydrolase fold protein n=1 Tax=Pseudomonas fluorescens TaxID=294 RepID=A0A448DYR5_PSEFL|nr:alpha/beta hydrolase [Pseudomonas fluorescens]VEF11910.1 alpha/beta hydrolase fold protein [Pseudomonas fluorescens]
MKQSHRKNLTWVLVGAAGLCTVAGYRSYRRLARTPALSEKSLQLGINGQYIQAGPWRMFTRSVGDIGSPVVVLVHGLVISSRYMEPLALALAGNGYRVLAPDMPGYGESVVGSPRSSLSIESLSDALFMWLTAMNVGKASFIGNSFGCQVLTMLAVRHPAVVDRLVLQGLTVNPDARNLFTQISRAVLNGRRERQRSSADIGRVDYAKAGPWRALTSMYRLIRDRVETRLPSIQSPCLILQGTRDPVVPTPWAQRACDLLPNGQFRLLEGATHTMNYVYPFSFAQAVADFLGEENHSGRIDK